MNRFVIILLALASTLLGGCSPVKSVVTNQYKLSAYSAKKLANHQSSVSILVNAPEAVGGYQTEQMLYMEKPFEISSFAYNAWANPPADMLFPLIMQSLQRSGYFYAVASSPTSEKTDYRLDTQLIELQQNFLQKPSTIHFIAKIVLTHLDDNRVIASRIISLRIPCPRESPYGGVLAANQATLSFTNQLTEFVVGVIKRTNNR
ncbi:ABC-type transport auxiliary lipoprotein family protein [Legionella spiritensis]|uniref:Transport protein n=1 Tax=Legionella spiritensis TaxID=452 RepID=A0A0W0Z5I7_LEGSP|nr:ABC-type transport auxiliary lipoprotein family protein [Legionella spiritensis]KTD64412.1 transport protein [Legionella spiritensis]SNV46027.1 ABC transporter auxiliary component [Legionella spiritensis]VEG91023.1 ABC transporter auxiliary component [Legionella spiritensis]